VEFLDALSNIEKLFGGVVGVVLIWLLTKTFFLFRTWGQFITDWTGQKARKGRDEVPGVMARLNKLDGELSHNGGKSIKDVVVRLEARQDILEQKLEEAEIARHQNHIALLEAIKALSPRKTKN
jgi:hypothetical protein